MKYILFKDYKNFNPESLSLGSKNSMPTYNKRDFYIVTSEFTVVNITTESDYTVLTLKFNNRDFLSLIQLIDSLHLLKNDPEYFVAQQHFIPTLSLNPTTSQCNLINFKIPVCSGQPSIKVFDEHGDKIPFDIVDLNFKGKAIIQPMGIYSENNNIKTKWLVDQIKVTIPDVYFNKCVLSDNNEDVQIFL